MKLTHEFIFDLKRRFSGEIRVDLPTRILYSTDASMYQVEPLGVAIPKSQEDLHAAIESAVKFRVPVLPRGSGSSLGGQSIGAALILDCSRYLDHILEIDAESHSATVEPGVILADLNRSAAAHGLMFGPDPASGERATMGGVIGNNATGAHSIRYGMSADHILSAEVCLGDGSLETWDTEGRSRLAGLLSDFRSRYSDEVKERFPRTWRNSAGYRLNYLIPWSPSTPAQWDRDDHGMPQSVYRAGSEVNLAALLAGSEGTLGVIRRMKVNLVHKPRHTILGVLCYDDIAAACDEVPRLLDFHPSAIELIPNLIIRLARGVPAYARQMNWLSGDPAAVLVVEFSGNDPAGLKSEVRQLGDLLTIAESEEGQGRVWGVRKMGLGIMDSRPRTARPAAFIEDCVVPVDRLGEFVRQVEKILAAHGTEGGIYAHASAGCLHIRPILDLHLGEGVRALRSIAEQVLEVTLRLGGSMTSEHGDGIVAGEWIERTYGRSLTEAMRRIKHAVDPYQLLNPNKMYDAPPMDENLRYRPGRPPSPWPAALQFPHEAGLAGAIEQCNGQGVCRKTTGVMCPSFQATREEGNSTRGRANLLRALIREGWHATHHGGAGSTSAPQWTLQDAVFSALDLCLACKGCTSECPSGVDMPKLKYEFLNEYYKSRRRPLRDYLFGYFHVVSKWIAPAAPIYNFLVSAGWLRRLLAKAAGITDRRLLPAYATWRARPSGRANGGGQVLFLSDVFSRYLEPDVEKASFDILAALGCNVAVLSSIGAGASLLSKGLIDPARRHASKVLDEILAHPAANELCIVGCEPAEIYCLKHEYAALLPERRAEVESIAARVYLFEEFVLRHGELENLRIAKKNNSAIHKSSQYRITFHPHCHQRAEGLAGDGLPCGSSATEALLRTLGCDVDTIDAGCCGMAGSFGYDAEHYDLSMQVGELGVFPLMRAAVTREGRLAVSTGSACRIHIRQALGIEVVHPVELIQRVLVIPGPG